MSHGPFHCQKRLRRFDPFGDRLRLVLAPAALTLPLCGSRSAGAADVPSGKQNGCSLCFCRKKEEELRTSPKAEMKLASVCNCWKEGSGRTTFCRGHHEPRYFAIRIAGALVPLVRVLSESGPRRKFVRRDPVFQRYAGAGPEERSSGLTLFFRAITAVIW